ncbi:MAG: ureE 2 [Phycisphaerales bacterium]|nr:ureE 2 [Phycisphaerales bacterium]
MLVDRVLGRHDAAAAAATSGAAEAGRLDVLDLQWDECHRRAHAKVTRGGRPVRVVLRLGTVLRDGDVLADRPDLLLVVRVVPCDLLVARPRSAAEAAVAALELGNLHAPVEVRDDGTLATPADGPAAGALAKHGVPFAVERRVFAPLAISGVTWTAGAGGAVVATTPARATGAPPPPVASRGPTP